MRIALVGLSPRVRGCAFYYLYELASMKTTENSSPLNPRLSLKCVLRLRCVCVAFALRFLIACYSRVSSLLIYCRARVCASRPRVLLEEACKEGLTWTSHILTSCGVVWFPPYRHRRYIILEPTARVQVFKIPLRSLPDERQTTYRTLRQEVRNVFAEAVDLSEFDIFVNVPQNQSTHNNLSSHSLQPSPVSTLTPSPRDSTTPFFSQLPVIMPSVMSTAPTVGMPARGDRSAPQFDPKQPRELRRYFADLDFHFARTGTVDDEQKKKHACRYVDIDTSELWEAIPQFADATVAYADFMLAIYALYPGSEEERKWSVADMDKLVGERSRLGIISLADLGDYYRQFLAITTFLRNKSRLSEAEQSRAFARGFQSEMWTRVSQRLQLKLPDHFPDDPYSLEAIHEAARYVLHGTQSTLLTIVSSTAAVTTTSPTAPSPSAEVKTEDIATILEKLSESFIKALATQHASRTAPTDRPARGSSACNFCGGLDHFMRECLIALEFIRAGKCKRNVDGKITLPTGAFVPRDIPGQWFKDRIDEWHRRNPGQLGVAQMMYRVLANGIANVADPPKQIIVTRDSHPRLLDAPIQLTAQEHVKSLEHELFQLRHT